MIPAFTLAENVAAYRAARAALKRTRPGTVADYRAFARLAAIIIRARDAGHLPALLDEVNA